MGEYLLDFQACGYAPFLRTNWARHHEEIDLRYGAFGSGRFGAGSPATVKYQMALGGRRIDRVYLEGRLEGIFLLIRRCCSWLVSSIWLLNTRNTLIMLSMMNTNGTEVAGTTGLV